MLYWILKVIAVILCKVLFRIKVFGEKNIPQKGGFILASNHLSYLDPVVLGVACPRRLNFMARHDLFNNPIFSWLISNVGAFPVKRASADVSAIKIAMERLKDGGALVLFPEGSRKINAGTFQVHSGIGFLASKLNVPVIPVFIKGTDYALPRGAKFIRSHYICVYFGKQIALERRLPYQDIAGEVMRSIRRLAC